MKVRCRGLLLDLDGVLVDSTPAVARCWTRWSQLHGFDAKEVVRRAHGRPSLATLRELLPDADYEAEHRQMERWEIEDISDVVALPGAVNLLRALPSERWAIVTSCTTPLAEVRIRVGGFPWPKQLVTSSDVQRGKPDPEPYLKGAACLGLAPIDCIVIEDAPSGIRAGKASGARVLALRTTDADSELTAAGADWIVTDLGSVGLDACVRADAAIELLLRNSAQRATPPA
jgi:mannitol-1-/sugar-/sorbitol-6-phosphatase